ncbi:hypothetical protein VTJ04DRAFT_2983 [Mycothermus thermophilus]|uniref:uncharacterized protein n=1 Tax=Humicola insolens TaxID=85995 RepID=UPI003742C2B3
MPASIGQRAPMSVRSLPGGEVGAGGEVELKKTSPRQSVKSNTPNCRNKNHRPSITKLFHKNKHTIPLFVPPHTHTPS